MTTKKTVSKKTTTRKADTILGSASEIWLAGLGAFAKAQEEGVKIFSKLVSEGKEFEETFKKVPEKAAKEVSSKVSEVKSKVDEVKKKAWLKAKASLPLKRQQPRSKKWLKKSPRKPPKRLGQPAKLSRKRLAAPARQAKKQPPRPKPRGLAHGRKLLLAKPFFNIGHGG